MLSSIAICTHPNLIAFPSPHATSAGYQQPTPEQRLAATTPSGRVPKRNGEAAGNESYLVSSLTFPAPLILPGDDLALDPRYPPQSFRAWKQGKDRNEVTAERKIIYVAAPPGVADDAAFARTWTGCVSRGTNIASPKPHVEDVVEFLKAFYHGLTVKLLPSPELRFTTWDTAIDASSKSKLKGNRRAKTTPSQSPAYIALNTPTESIRIRARPTPSGPYSHQLHLDDLLDAAISTLPTDAYALLLLVDHDLYEDDEDEFVCGRAFGGSRVAVVSSARYDPGLDEVQGVEREHAWPAAHCAAYVEECCNGESQPKRKKSKPTNPDVTLVSSSTSLTHDTSLSPLQAALQAHISHPSVGPSNGTSPAPPHLYLARLCRTSAHELAHCLGIDHCVYYACCMQGSASLAEDARQPMYLCPVDLRKVLAACAGANSTGKGKSKDKGKSTAGQEDKEDGENARMKQRYEALMEFCGRFGDGQVFAAFGAWLGGRLGELEVEIKRRKE